MKGKQHVIALAEAFGIVNKNVLGRKGDDKQVYEILF